MYDSENKDPSLLEPSDSDTLWRYQTFCKFQSLVKEGALFFCRLDNLDDPREGRLPRATADSIRDFLVIPNRDDTINLLDKVTRATLTVNCWQLSEHENSLMWSSYAKPGIAIKTTFSSLKESLKFSNSYVQGGIVQYIDHETDDAIRVQSEGQGKTWLSNEIATLKFQGFNGEREFRLISNLLYKVQDGKTGEIIEPKRTANGIYVNVNLYRLLHEVVVSPDAEDELESKVRSLVEPINSRLPRSQQILIRRSNLYG